MNFNIIPVKKLAIILSPEFSDVFDEPLFDIKFSI